MSKFERFLVDYCKRKLRKYPDNYIVGNKEPYITALRVAKKEIEEEDIEIKTSRR